MLAFLINSFTKTFEIVLCARLEDQIYDMHVALPTTSAQDKHH